MASNDRESAVPPRLRQAIRLRARAINHLLLMTQRGLDVHLSQLIVIVKRITDLDRYIDSRQWVRAAVGFDPIMIGM